MARKHLIVGGLGYLGSGLTEALRAGASGDAVHVVDLNWFDAPVPPGIQLHKRDAWELGEADLAGFESVTMLSGLANDKVVAADPRGNFRENLALPCHLAWAARQAGVRRFVFASTTSLYESAGDELWTESMEPRPVSPPSLVKLQVEKALECWASEAFRVYAFRLGTIGGWSARPRLDLVINTMCKTAVAEGVVRVNGASVWRSTVSARNAGAVFAEACAGSRLAPGVYNLVEGPHTLGEIAEAVLAEAKALGIAARLELRDDGPRRNFRADGAKLRAALPGFAWDDPHAIAREVLTALRALPRAALESATFSNYQTWLESRKP